MVGLVVMLRRFVRAIRDAWNSDEAFRMLLALVVSLLVSGTTFFTLVEGWSVLDAFYFSVTTLTTVGFGDPAPATAAGKIFTILYIFVGLSASSAGSSTSWRSTLSPDRGDEGASVKSRRRARVKPRRVLPAASLHLRRPRGGGSR
jgi:voltage-gated potassium channel